MKKILCFSAMLVVAACTKMNYGPEPSSQYCCGPRIADTTGTVQFYTLDRQIAPSCGTITVTMNTGQQVKIYRSYGPDKYVGGSIRLQPGNYTYTLKGSYGCNLSGGSVVVKVNSIQYVEF